MKKLFVFIIASLILSSCVGKGTYKGAMREIELLEERVAVLEEEKEALENENADLEEQVETLEDIIERARRNVRDADLELSIEDSFSASFSLSTALRILNEL